MKTINIPQLPQTVKLTIHMGEDPKKAALIGLGLYLAAKKGAERGVRVGESRPRPYYGNMRSRRIGGMGPIQVIRGFAGDKVGDLLYGKPKPRPVRFLEDEEMGPMTETQDAKRGDES